jgi:hypothetical protein
MNGNRCFAAGLAKRKGEKFMKRRFKLDFERRSFWALLGMACLLVAMNACTTRTLARRETRSDDAARTISGKTTPEIVGKWLKKTSKNVEYARYADGTGSVETLEINADGSVKDRTTNAYKVYDCPVEENSRREGALVVESATQLSLTFDAGTVEHEEACAPAKNHTDATKPTVIVYQWQIAQSNDGTSELCLTNGGETICYIKI